MGIAGDDDPPKPMAARLIAPAPAPTPEQDAAPPLGIPEAVSWEVRFFFNPAKYIMWVVLATAITILVLGICSFVLHMMEHLDDRKERKRDMLNINYEAL